MKSLAYIIGMAMALIPAQLAAQAGRPTLQEIDSILNPPLLEGEEILHFDTPELNIGSLSEDDAPVMYPFRFRNVSGKSVALTRITTSCGCTTAEMDKTVIGPDETGEIRLIFNPSGQAGSLYKTAFVYTAFSARQPTGKIALTGEVRPTSDKWADYPYAMGNFLRLRRPGVWFREIGLTAICTERVACINSGKIPLKLFADIIPSYATLRTEPECIAPGEEADLVITLQADLLPDSIKDEYVFPIIIEGMPIKPSDRTLRVKISLQKK